MICTSCDKDRPIGDFRSRGSERPDRRCRYCRAARTRTINRWHELGRACRRCSEVKPCPEEITDHVSTRAGVCKACLKIKERERQREWARMKRETDPEFRHRQVEATMRWLARNPGYRDAAEKRRYQAIKSNPERWDRWKQDARMRYRLRQMRSGAGVRVLSEKRYLKRYGTGRGKNDQRVDPAPLLGLLADAILPVVAECTGLSESFIERILHGHYAAGISIPDADRLCTFFQIPLTLAYPELKAA